ncbi:MAG TPA: hypothetical protein V6D22_10885 [Candidatus Obscuribacterales bacterium]
MNSKETIRIALTCLVLLGSTSVAFAATPSDEVLHGRIESRTGPTRLQRPGTPVLQSAAEQQPGCKPASSLKALVDFGDFTFGQPAQKPEFAKIDDIAGGATPEPSAKPLESGTDEGALLIAWEEWHKRICKAIYENWLANSKIEGVAHTTICITRDRHITVTVEDVSISPMALARFPRGAQLVEERLETEFRKEIADTVQPLDGSMVFDFPSRSQRQEVVFHPYFRKEGNRGYDWTKGDYERVPVNQ